MSEPETPKLITIQITPKVEDDDAYKLAQTYTVTKLTASEMKLKGLRPDLIGKQPKVDHNPYIVVIKLSRHTPKK